MPEQSGHKGPRQQLTDSIRRSWLLTPASDRQLLEQAGSSGADVVVLDLMDLVPERDKQEARQRLEEAISAITGSGVEVFVQIDPQLAYADLQASIWPGLAGVVASRAESVRQIAEIDDLITELEQKRGILPGTVQLVASLETAKGNQSAFDISRASSRMWGLTLGRADLVMDLRPEPSGEIHLMQYLMQRLIIVANASGLVPIGAWWQAPARGLMASPEETFEAAVRGRAIGFKSAMCLLPEQVEPLNRGFSATT